MANRLLSRELYQHNIARNGHRFTLDSGCVDGQNNGFLDEPSSRLFRCAICKKQSVSAAVASKPILFQQISSATRRLHVSTFRSGHRGSSCYRVHPASRPIFDVALVRSLSAFVICHSRARSHTCRRSQGEPGFLFSAKEWATTWIAG